MILIITLEVDSSKDVCSLNSSTLYFTIKEKTQSFNVFAPIEPKHIKIYLSIKIITFF